MARGVNIDIAGTAHAIIARFLKSLEWQECVGDATPLQITVGNK